MKRVLLTGASGFIGKNIIRFLPYDYDIVAINSSFLDLTDETEVDNFFIRHGYFDSVIHCAVKGGHRNRPDPEGALKNNTEMYFNLRKNKDYFGKFIHFGSGAEIYGKTEYAKSKREIANSIKETKNFYNIRLFGVFGSGELQTRFFSSNIKNYIEGNPMIVNEDMYMDFFYIKDLVTVIDYYLKKPNPPKEIDCVYQTDIVKLSQLADMINELSDKKVEIRILFQEIMGNVKHYVGSGSRLEELNLPLLGLHYGIQEMYKKMNK
jgi:nucleoside-diphosphate-sugar epimerase